MIQLFTELESGMEPSLPNELSNSFVISFQLGKHLDVVRRGDDGVYHLNPLEAPWLARRGSQGVLRDGIFAGGPDDQIRSWNMVVVQYELCIHIYLYMYTVYVYVYVYVYVWNFQP